MFNALVTKKKNEIKGYLLFVRGGRYHNVIYSDIYVINEFNLLNYLGFLLHVVAVYISDVLYQGNDEQIEKKKKKQRNKTLTRFNVDD